MSLTFPELDALLADGGPKAELLYARAGLLATQGRDEEARRDYLAAIALEPTHFGALNDLGNLLYRTDFRSAARLAYAEAVKYHPGNPVGRINLANALLAEEHIEEARLQYEAALSLAPNHAEAHQGMANLLQLLGDADAAEQHRQKSVIGRPVAVLSYRGEGPPCRVLLLVSAAGGNTPTRFLLDETLFETSVLVVEAHAAAAVLPPHDLVFNAVGDADLGPSALDAAAAALARSGAGVINPPDRVRTTGRAGIAQSLGRLTDVVTPKVVVAPRVTAAETAQAFGYPLLLRSPGFHSGRHFGKVDAPDDLPAAMADLPGRELMIIEYLNARDALGRARKYRVMIVDGELFPLHLAISSDWKVHYFTAQMAEQAEHRALEAAFLADMPSVLGPRAMSALARIGQSLGLDYAGVDFALDADGRVLLFEANATMVVNPPEPDPLWDYRRAPVQRVLDAVHAMLLRRAGR